MGDPTGEALRLWQRRGEHSRLIEWPDRLTGLGGAYQVQTVEHCLASPLGLTPRLWRRTSCSGRSRTRDVGVRRRKVPCRTGHDVMIEPPIIHHIIKRRPGECLCYLDLIALKRTR